MSKVLYKKVTKETSVDDINRYVKLLLEKVVDEENIDLNKDIPLKVHFGEKGNKTFIKPENYNGIIEFLKHRDIKSCFMESTVLYGGQRFKRDLHIKTAKEHGFTQLPVVIADGDHGEDFVDVEINKKHFDKCKIGKKFLDYNQLIVVSHFKGHMLAGFGGAIKQLSMGHAAKGGKLAMHMGIKPKIKNNKCKECHLCESRCAEDSISIGKQSYINHDICVGCGACVAICPHKAISIFSIKGILNALGFGGNFKEKVVEYALAAQQGKKNIYINYAMNITAGCDCEPRNMKILTDDVGIFISTDPVAIDKACFDMVKEMGKKFKGEKSFTYAESIGLGSMKYELVEIS